MVLLNRRRCLAAAMGSALPLHLAAQGSGPRVALVIGNAAYANAPLDNPGRDARGVAEALRGMGFTVHDLIDADLGAMRAAVSQVRSALQGRQGTGLLFYAGHGLQLDWRNYMVPLRARLDSADDVPARTLGVHEVVDAWRAAGTRTNVVVLDACRDNPFGALSTGRGLAPLDAPPGTFFAYATAPGAVASDGAAGGHGLYTRYLLQELQGADQPIEQLFKRVRLQVRQASQGRQIPWESTSLEEDFRFRAGVVPEVPVPAVAGAARQEAARQEEQAWTRVKASRQPEDLTGFLLSHAQSPYAEQAQYRLDQLQLERVLPQAAPGQAPLRPGARRFEVGDVCEFSRQVEAGRRTVTPLRLEATWVSDEAVIFNNFGADGDQLGNLWRIARKAFPGVDDFPESLCGAAELTPGRRWTLAGGRREGKAFLDLAFRVGTRETVQVPAGRFDTVRVHAKGSLDEPNGRITLERTLWVAPELMLAVRQHLFERRTGWPNGHHRDELIELARLHRAPRTA